MISKYKGREKEYHKEWYINNAETVSEKQYLYKNSEEGFLISVIGSIYIPSKVKERGYAPECTKKEIKNYFYEYINKYGRNCYYCLEPWTYLRKKINVGNGRNTKKLKRCSTNFSIDRLDNSKTYSIDNIVFCCSLCNASKNKISIKLIKRLHEIITERNL
jgi:hypothetical protein